MKACWSHADAAPQLYRNPARLASDIRKVRAVDVPELALYKDVIVVPCKGSVSLPSMLAGGDVDGGTVASEPC